MTTFLALQNTYTCVEIALFQEMQICAMHRIDKQQASSLLMPTLREMLAAANLNLTDCSFIAANQGPGPFTTLRVVIASANGLSFASGIPLIGIDALDALLLEEADPAFPTTIALLNAFNKEVYFGIQLHGAAPYQKGYAPIEELLRTIQEKIRHAGIQDTVRFIGNGALLYEQNIKMAFGDQAYLPTSMPHTCSIEQIGLMGLERWRAQEAIAYQLLPLYLKQHTVHTIARKNT
jgi:tRNA threonylcarbamoyladenosine biosynthesis protein TsaB